MEVCSSAMGPERVLPNSEDELGEEQRPAEEAVLPGWSGGEGGGEEEEEEEGGGGDIPLEGEEEEEEEEEGNNGGYYYQPLNQEPDGVTGGEQEGAEPQPHAQQLLHLQNRIQVMGLHLPDAPPADSDEEEDPEGAAAIRSRASIPMDEDHVELVKRTMAAVALPSLAVPSWAREISEDQWKDLVQNTLDSRQSSAALRLPRRGNVSGP